MKNLYKRMIGVAGSVPMLAATASVALAQLEDVTVDVPTGFATSFSGLMNAVLSFIMVIAALLVFFYLIWGGIEWITSGGDKGQTEKARNKITAAVIGLIILAAAYAILTLVLNFLGFSNLDDVFQQSTSIPDASN